MSKPNIPLLRRVQRAILEHPEEFDMAYFFGRRACGTTACICGWSATLGSRHKSIILDLYGNKIEETATNMLRLSSDQSEKLFYLCFWPEFHLRWHNDIRFTDDYEGMALCAFERIEHFIQTGE